MTPFKSQNMSLNSFVTLKGEEIARSIAVQARAAKEEPVVEMNPILLKPVSDFQSQVIIHGKAVGNVDASDYFFSENWRSTKWNAIGSAINKLASEFDVVVAEGAGSCAEPNLMNHDIVNLKVAELLDADVFLVCDIDKGGVIASLLGTFHIIKQFSPHSVERIKGVIINKFRGKRAILKEAINYIEKETGVRVVSVLPYIHDLHFEEEDRVKAKTATNPEIDVAVIYLPHISNASDFNPLSLEENVQVRYVSFPDQLGCPDLIVLPGTKATIWDLNYLRKIGWEETLNTCQGKIPIMGICGGLEMLGNYLFDLEGFESSINQARGLRFLDFDVEFQKDKIVSQVSYEPAFNSPFLEAGPVEGYEIHRGVIDYKCESPLFVSNGKRDGVLSENRQVFGTFIHDIFKNSLFTRVLVNALREKKSLNPLNSPLIDYQSYCEAQFDKLGKIIESESQFYPKKSFLSCPL